MKDYSKEELKDFINTLISHGYINYGGEYPVVKQNTKSLEVIKGNEKVLFKEERKIQKLDTNNNLFAILKDVRRDIAMEEGVPPYIVFGDNTLKDMSVRMPINNTQLIEISGVGEKKIEKYGDKFLNKIKEYIDENKIEVKWSHKDNNKKSDKGNDKKQSKGSNNGKQKSYEITINMIKEGKDFNCISEERGLAITTIISHIEQYMNAGNDIDFKIDFSDLFNREEEDKVLEVVDKIGFYRVKPIKDELSEEFSYDKIRFIILKKIIEEKRA